METLIVYWQSTEGYDEISTSFELLHMFCKAENKNKKLFKHRNAGLGD